MVKEHTVRVRPPLQSRVITPPLHLATPRSPRAQQHKVYRPCCPRQLTLYFHHLHPHRPLQGLLLQSLKIAVS